VSISGIARSRLLLADAEGQCRWNKAGYIAISTCPGLAEEKPTGMVDLWAISTARVLAKRT